MPARTVPLEPDLNSRKAFNTKKNKYIKGIKRHWQLYILILPALLYFIIFYYVPMYGVQIAFKDFVATKGIWGSEWVGFKHFINFFQTHAFDIVIKNTLNISIYSLIAGFPAPILLALMLNEVKSTRFKKLVQNWTYAPHFISTVVMVGMIVIFLGPNGAITQIVKLLTGVAPTNPLTKSRLFDDIYVWSGVWAGMGWGSIIYLAALAGVDPQLHEAATIDGATRLQRIYHVNIPCILPTIVIMLILRTGSIMGVGFEKVFLMQNAYNLETAEVISTYVYKVGLQQAHYSYSAAIGLFNTVVNLTLMLIVNKISKVLSDTALW